MPIYRIHCSSTTAYWLDVQAPSKGSAGRWYEAADGEEFILLEDYDGDWQLDEIEELESGTPHISVDKDGNVLSKTEVARAAHQSLLDVAKDTLCWMKEAGWDTDEEFDPGLNALLADIRRAIKNFEKT